jgi:endonuclease YncB( thermonuclease family)
MFKLLLAVFSCMQLTIWPGAVKRTIDGDTFVLWDAHIPGEIKVRLATVDAWELSDSLGPKAKAFTVAWLAQDPSTLLVCSLDKYGRYLGQMTRGTDTLAADLVHFGLAKKYYGER